MNCPQIVAKDGFSMCHMDKNLGFIFGAPMNTLEFYNSNFVSQIYKIPQDLWIVSTCQQDDMPHLHKFFVV
jgi:hypothetical protein